jgi:formylglycine-generating enzyme required for sulfatase activity
MSRSTAALVLLLAALVSLPVRAAAPAVEAAAGSAALVQQRVLSADAGSTTVELSWSRSWRDGPGSPRGNHDGLWVFAKARGDDERWRHVPLAAAEATAGFTAERTGDALGVFVFRAMPGEGDARTRLTLRWSPAGDLRVVRLFAWPVVYVPRGAFDAGDGSATTPGRFHDGGDPARPFRVTGAPIELAPRTGALWADDRSWPLPSGAPGPSPWDGRPGPLPAAFPTGHEPFWILRFEITQGQYADFLDALMSAQAEARAPSPQNFASGGRPRPDNYRYTITRTSGRWAAGQPRWSMNWLAWEDGIALADWAGLRPMTELEFEKAARGPRPAVPGEYAWGTTRIVAIRGFDGEDGSGQERATPPDANTSWSPSPQDRPLLGPYAASALADRPTREGRGESFWGIADLSGNLVEMAISLGLAAGRAFVPRHGDGELAADGSADVEGWPRMGTRTGAFGPFGYGYRGGDFYNPETDLRVSSRNVASFGGTRRLFGLGFRAVRSAGQ